MQFEHLENLMINELYDSFFWSNHHDKFQLNSIFKVFNIFKQSYFIYNSPYYWHISSGINSGILTFLNELLLF